MFGQYIPSIVSIVVAGSYVNMIIVLFPGFLHVGFNQTVVIDDTDPDVPINTHVYQSGHVKLPDRLFFQKTKLISDGTVSISF